MSNLILINSKLKFRRILAICLVIFSIIATVFAQSGSTTGSIVGRVVDSQDLVISGASLSVREIKTNLTRNVETDQNGIYQIIQLPPGVYEITAKTKGFDSQTTKVVISIGVTALIDITLNISQTQDFQLVTANTNETLFSNGINIKSVNIDNLPINRRNYLDFALTTPQVIADRLPPNGISATSGLSINGQSARRNNLSIDGFNNIDFSTGAVRAIFGQDAIEEYQVVADSFSAEFGRALGGTINIITKRGKNDFQASNFFSLRNEALSARNSFASINPEFRQYQFGISLSGPIKRDKAFFFSSFERTSVKQNIIVTIPDLFVRAARKQGFPVDNGIRPFSVGISYLITRMDLQTTTNNLLTLRYNGGFKYDGAFDTEGATLGGLVSDTASGIQRLSDNTLALNNTYVNSNLNLVNETRLLYSYRNQNVVALDENPSVRLTASIGRIFFGHNQTIPQLSQTSVYQIVNNTSLLRGKHQFRFGIDLLFNDVNNLNIDLQKSGVALFSEIDFTPNGGPFLSTEQTFDPLQRTSQQKAFLTFLSAFFPSSIPNFPNLPLADIPLPIAFLQGFGNGQVKPQTQYISAFFQDDFRLRPNLLVKAGLRYDFNNLSINPKSNGILSPRLSISYQPSKLPSLTLKASYGLFSSVPLTASTALANIFSSSKYQVLGFTFPFSVIPFNLPQRRFPLNLEAPKNVITNPEIGVNFSVDPNLGTSYSQQINLTLNYAVTNNSSISTSYSYVKGINLSGVRDINKIFQNVIDPRKGFVFETSTAFDSYYHALNISFNKKFNSSFATLVSYTYSKTIDNLVDDLRADLFISRTQNLRDSKALSIQDLRHRFVASSILDLSYIKKPIIKDFQLSTIVSLESGRPYDLVNETGRGVIGIGGRNQGILPGFANVDLRLQKRTFIKEKYQLQTYVEIFNLFNRVNIDADINQFFQTDPTGNLNLPEQENGRFILPKNRFVRSLNARQIQIGVRFSFMR
ncbi:MAG: carboxypeptidase regulatory-like domain-containing protein [Blastocatellia bacterium]